MNSKLPVYKYSPPRNDKAKGDLHCRLAAIIGSNRRYIAG